LSTRFSAGPALVAQGIEHRFPKPGVAGSNPAGGTPIPQVRGPFPRFRDHGGPELGHRMATPSWYALTVASIRKRNGSYQVRYRDPNGRMRSKTFRRKIDATHFAQTIEADKARGDWLDPRLARMTFGRYVEEWRPAIANLKPTTRAGYESLLRAHLLRAFGNAPLGKIKPKDVQAFIADLERRELSPARIRQAYRLLSMILKSAVESDYIAKSPCVGIRLRKWTKKPANYLSAEEVRRLATAAGPEYETLILLLAYGGLRWGETIALRRGRCNLLKRNIEILESASEADGQLHFGDTKTYEHRTVPLPVFLVEKLARHLEKVPRDPEALVFTTRNSQPLRGSNWRRRVWFPALEAAGLPPETRIHDLRHTCASLLIEQGHSPKAVRAHLGHSSITVTMDTYGHLYREERERIAAGLQAVYQGAKA
jgi:integrase